MSSAVKIPHKARLPATGCLVVPGRVEPTELPQLEQLFAGRKVTWLIEENASLDPAAQAFLERSGSGAVFSDSDADPAAAGAQLKGLIEDGAVLIWGSGHARKDRGVPFILKAREPGRSVVSIGLMEVHEGAADFADYLDEGETALPFDFVMFTAKANDIDHCAALKKKMGK